MLVRPVPHYHITAEDPKWGTRKYIVKEYLDAMREVEKEQAAGKPVSMSALCHCTDLLEQIRKT